ncbi:MAG: hypothetical protein Q9169_007922 [Polycauliona sp. 2 TL-2023]
MSAGNISPAGLELDRRSQRDGHLAPIAISPQEGKIAAYDNGKIIDFHDGGKHVVPTPPPTRHVDSQVFTPTPEVTPRIFGLKRKTFFYLLLVGLLIILAGAVGGGVGVTRSARAKEESRTSSNLAPPPVPTSIIVSRPPPGRYINTGLAALQWIDLDGTLHKNVYYQDRTNKIRESASENSTSLRSPWQINTISDSVKSGTPLAAVAGYPHADYDYSPVSMMPITIHTGRPDAFLQVKNVYHMTINDELSERQASANASQAWEDDNFSGLYQGYNGTYLAAYWNQDFDRETQQLVVLFQEESFANGITQGRYTSNTRTSNPWIADRFGFSQPQGSTFAVCPLSYRNSKQIMLYTVDSGRNLQQHEYTISEDNLNPGTVISLARESATGRTVESRSPLAIGVQDN